MHRTAEQWAHVKASAVASGSNAQAENVLQMALDDIAELHRRLAGGANARAAARLDVIPDTLRGGGCPAPPRFTLSEIVHSMPD